VIATATIVAGQTAVVSLLLIEGARRRRAEVTIHDSVPNPQFKIARSG